MIIVRRTRSPKIPAKTSLLALVWLSLLSLILSLAKASEEIRQYIPKAISSSDFHAYIKECQNYNKLKTHDRICTLVRAYLLNCSSYQEMEKIVDENFKIFRYVWSHSSLLMA